MRGEDRGVALGPQWRREERKKGRRRRRRREGQGL
jgi:hypothetical protein